MSEDYSGFVPNFVNGFTSQRTHFEQHDKRRKRGPKPIMRPKGTLPSEVYVPRIVNGVWRPNAPGFPDVPNTGTVDSATSQV